MIKTLFLLGVVFVLTYDPASGGLDNLFGASQQQQQGPSQQQQQQQQPAGRLEQYTVQAHPRVQQVQAQQDQIQVRAPSHYGYANKHQHFEAVQFGTTGYEYRTNMPGASLY